MELRRNHSSTHPSPSPLDFLWGPSVVIWVLIAGEGLAGVLTLAVGAVDSRLVYFGLASLVVQWTSLLAMAGLYLMRRWLGRLRPLHVALVSLLLLLLSAAAVQALMWGALAPYFSAPEDDWPSLVLRLTGVVSIVGGLGVAAFHRHWQARQLAVRAMQYELDALQARIRPHFLFNTLNTSIALVREQPEKAEETLLALSDLFRAALAAGCEIPLDQEFALSRSYLEIERTRFGSRLDVDWQVSDNLPEVTVPGLLIQPLLENAIRHGIEQMPLGGCISLAATFLDGSITIEIRNPLPDSPTMDSRGHSIGLSSTRARLGAMTNGPGQLKVVCQESTFIVLLKIPTARAFN